MRSSISLVDVDRTETWTRYRAGLCDSCAANCCTMPVEIRLPDLVRLGLVDAFEAEHEEPRLIARRLVKSKQVERYNQKDGIFTMARRANGDCQFLDEATRRCSVYEQAPRHLPQAPAGRAAAGVLPVWGEAGCGRRRGWRRRLTEPKGTMPSRPFEGCTSVLLSPTFRPHMRVQFYG
jgi:Fe-S-cluster containining protein